MQNFLLTIASVVILAIAAAFAAPFLIDWTQFRSVIEEQASARIGVPVTIGGAIDVQLLPAPKLLLQQVSVGAPGAATQLSVGELRGDFSLGELMRGRFVAERLTLARPALSLDLDDLRRLAAGRDAAAFSIAALVIEDGALELRDRASGHTLRVAGADLTGDLGSLRGPLKLEGEIGSGGAQRRLRLAMAGLETDGSTRLRATVQSLDTPMSFDVDGVLRIAGPAPSFEGKASLSLQPREAPALRGVAGTPAAGWSLSATVAATPELVEARELALRLGASERPVELNGKARLIRPLELGAGSRLELALAARQLDLSAATGNAAPLAALNAVAATLAPLSRVAATGTLDFSSDTVLLAGAAMREVKAGLDWSAEGWSARALEARLPGRAGIKLAGALPGTRGTRAGDELFAGTVDLTAEDLAAFAAWAAPEAPALLAGLPAGSARLTGGIAIGPERVAFDAATLSVGTMTLTGGGAYAFPPGERGKVEATLAAEGVDLDPLLVPVRRLLAMSGEKLDVALGFKGRRVRLAGVDAGQIDLALATAPEGLSIQRLALDDFGGLDVTGSGLLVSPEAGHAASADGRFEARLAGTKADGLPALARTFGLARIEELVARLGPTLAPVDVGLTLSADKGVLDLDARGRLGMIEGSATATFGGGRELSGTVGLNIDDGSALLARLGLTALRPKLGPARLDATLNRQFEGELLFAGAELTARGGFSFDEVGRLQPDVSLKLDGADLSRLFPALAQGGIASLPASLQGALGRDGASWRVEGLTGTVGGQKIDGRAAYLPGEAQPIDAELSLDRWSLPTALALVSGTPAPGSGAGWPDGVFGRAPLAALSATVRLEVATLDLPAGLAIDGAKLRLRLSDGAATIEEITGSLAGGRLAGRFDLRRRGELAQIDGHLALNDADIAQLARAAGAARPGVSGRTTVNLDASGAGRSPRAIAAALSGQGSLTVSGLEIAGADPEALAYAMRATEAGLPPDEARITAVLEEGLARGPLKLAQGESALGLVGGVVRSGSARFSEGTRRFALSGALDLPQLAFEATLEMEDPAAGPQAAMPAAALVWRGPLDAPARRVDVTGLSAAINMRALERETRRLEEEFRRQPPVQQPPVQQTPAQSAPAQPAPATAPTVAVPVPKPAPTPFTMRPRDVAPRPAPLRAGEVRSSPLPPPMSLQPPTTDRGAGAPYGGAQAAPQAAPALPPPIDIPVDVLRSPIMAPPLAP
ncbi:AsmA family protein [Ancylobacter sp. G4_0304]|uniref:AsmA family protein n=1 Tax=Ancylobacter sp. G4_0304 TaxID=3114289 RepID=UPI0039C64174